MATQPHPRTTTSRLGGMARWIRDSLRTPGVAMVESMAHAGHGSMAVHVGYQRNAEDDDMRRVAALVRQRRPSPMDPPPVEPTRGGNGALSADRDSLHQLA